MASHLCEISDAGKDCTSLKNISHTQDRNTASPLCEISDVWKNWTSVKNISRTQDRNKASPLCEISDVCKDSTFLKNISRSQDTNKAFLLCEISDVTGMWFLLHVRCLMSVIKGLVRKTFPALRTGVWFFFPRVKPLMCDKT
ncbi:unnamed protein product [Staurois parvus]|uniref:Uncharacterized protein n=1 Tax=Staurois parvus TaxID=386267 RepID=A0ABN9A8M0_9NEOB|nr:unnamed protein product [Staurois parvus]